MARFLLDLTVVTGGGVDSALSSYPQCYPEMVEIDFGRIRSVNKNRGFYDQGRKKR